MDMRTGAGLGERRRGGGETGFGGRESVKRVKRAKRVKRVKGKEGERDMIRGM